MTTEGGLSLTVGGYELVLTRRWRAGSSVFEGTETHEDVPPSTLYAVFGTTDGQASQTVAKVLRGSTCWIEQLERCAHQSDGNVEECPLFDATEGTWTGQWRSMFDHRGASRLILQFGRYVLAASQVGEEWQGSEIEVETLEAARSLVRNLPSGRSLFDAADARFVLIEVADFPS